MYLILIANKNKQTNLLWPADDLPGSWFRESYRPEGAVEQSRKSSELLLEDSAKIDRSDQKEEWKSSEGVHKKLKPFQGAAGFKEKLFQVCVISGSCNLRANKSKYHSESTSHNSR
jgi:hypothetical protein